MATLGDLIVNLKLQAQEFVSGVDSALGKWNAFSGSLLAGGAALTAGVTAPITALGIAAFSSAGKIESLSMGLTAVMGSSEAAAGELENLKEVAKLPGLGLPEAIQGSVRLQAVGYSAKEAADSLKSFGNAIATTGGGRAELDRVINQLTQMASAGKILTQDLRPVIQTVPLLGKVLQESFGTIDAEAISKKMEKMGLSSKDFVNMISAELAKLPQVTGGITNTMENLSDTITISLAKVGNAIAPIVSKIVNAVVPVITGLADAFANLSPTMQTAIIAVGGLAAAIGPVLLALGGLSAGVSAVAGLLGVAGLGGILAAVGAALPPIAVAVAAVAAAWGLWQLEPVRNAVDATIVGLRILWDLLKAGVSLLGDLVSPIIEAVAGSFGKAHDAVVFWSNTIGSVFSKAIEFVAGAFQTLFEWLNKIPGVSSVLGKLGDVAGSLSAKVGQYWQELHKADDATAGVAKTTEQAAAATNKFGSSTESLEETFKKLNKEAKEAELNFKAVLAAYNKGKATTEALTKAQLALWKAQDAADPERVVKRWEKANQAMLDRYDKEAKEQKKLIESTAELVRKITQADSDIASSAAKLAVDFGKSHEDIRKATLETVNVVVPENKRLPEGIYEAIQAHAALAEAAKRMSVSSIEDLRHTADQAEIDYTRIKDSGIFSADAVLAAQVRSIKAQQEARKAAGEEITAAEKSQLAALEAELARSTGKQKSLWQDTMKDVSTVVTNTAQSIVGILVGTQDGSIGDAFKKLGEGILSSFTEPAIKYLNDFIEKGLKKLLGWLVGDDGILGGLGKIGSAISGIFGGGAGGAASTATGGAASAASGAIGAGGSAASSLSGSLISGGLAAAGGILGGFITAWMQGGDLGKTEENTRGTLAQLRDGIQPKINEHLPKLDSISGYLWDVGHGLWVNMSSALKDSIEPNVKTIMYDISEIKTGFKTLSTADLAAVGTVNVEFNNVNFRNREDVDYLMTEMDRRLREAIKI